MNNNLIGKSENLNNGTLNSSFNLNIPLKRFGIKDKYSKLHGNRSWLQNFYEIDVSTVTKEIISWYKKIKI